MRRDIPQKRITQWYRGANAKPILYNTEILKYITEVFITEGLVDSILLSKEFGIPSVSFTGGAGGFQVDWFKFFNKISSVLYIMDNDRAGKLSAKKVASILGTQRTKIYVFEGKRKGYDTVDYFRDGGTIDEFINLVRTKSRFLSEIEEVQVEG